MNQKKEARELPNNTGNRKDCDKGTKRKRIIQYEIVRKWTPAHEVITMERSGI